MGVPDYRLKGLPHGRGRRHWTRENLQTGEPGPVKRDPTALPGWRTRKILSFIEDNLGSRIYLRSLATSVGMSRTHLSRVFKLRFGVTLCFYITCRRVVKAQNLMLTSRDRLCEIALRCGMCDQAHFARVFRRLVGQTPGRWREAHTAAVCSGDLELPLDLTTELLRRRDPLGATIDCQGLQASLEKARTLSQPQHREM
jgi:AraC-like DNA-binding protein